MTGLVNAELARNREDFKLEEGKKIEQTYIYCCKLHREFHLFLPLMNTLRNEYLKNSWKVIKGRNLAMPFCLSVPFFLDLKPTITTP